jgi:hypothetical protein
MPNMKVRPITISAMRRKSRRFASDIFASPRVGSLLGCCARAASGHVVAAPPDEIASFQARAAGREGLHNN